MIEAHNISKSFGDHDVLKNISLKFVEGKTNLIIGKSGSGKTVLMKCLVGLHEVDQGSILFDERNFSGMTFSERKSIRKEIGMLFQGGALFDSMTVEENVMFPLTMYTNQTVEEKKERVNFCLQWVNLENANKLFPAELSGGMIKRVAIARAISMNPRYLFCDEPNSGLDPHTAGVIDDLIQQITSEFNITTVVNTHDMNSVIKIGDTISFIYNGKLWWEGDKSQILHTENQELNDFVFDTELTKRLKK
ncbi:MAG TPA: ATP-binding cassette domain-containing protein [Bacteroidales bacterium]|nr:ATP-binding cassette domain-containing protein [Bacteroidales bacterium]HPE55635.1 ATP-binding cassette domain-containing protein [Bacteroidales bacterium]HRX96210.1 ATP-binding cassette domain-containing protein [Bacteroidales bacterium]